MTAKEIFQAAYTAQREIRNLESRRDHYIEMAMSASGMSETHIRNTEVRSRTESAAIGLVDVADKLQEQMVAYLGAVKAAEELIAKIEKPRFREVLTLHYLEGRGWAEVGARMGYRDPGSVFRVHRWALKIAEKCIVNATNKV